MITISKQRSDLPKHAVCEHNILIYIKKKRIYRLNVPKSIARN